MALQNIDNLPAVTVGTTAVRLVQPGTQLARVNAPYNYLMFRVPDGTNGTPTFSGTLAFAFMQRYTDDGAGAAAMPDDATVKLNVRRAAIAPGVDVGLSVGINVDVWVWVSAGSVAITPTIGIEDNR